MVDGGRRHRDGGDAADKDAADGRAQPNPGGREGAGRQDRKLVPAVALLHPDRLVAELFGQLHTFHNLPRCQTSRQRQPDTCHGRFLPVAVILRAPAHGPPAQSTSWVAAPSRQLQYDSAHWHHDTLSSFSASQHRMRARPPLRLPLYLLPSEALAGPYRQCSKGITLRPKSSTPRTKSSKMHITPVRRSRAASASSCLATVAWLPTTLPILSANAFCICVTIAAALPEASGWVCPVMRALAWPIMKAIALRSAPSR